MIEEILSSLKVFVISELNKCHNVAEIVVQIKKGYDL